MADTTPTLDPEKLRRERGLLLTDIDPSPWIAQHRREMEAEALREMNSAAPERAAGTLTGHTPAGQPDSEETQQPNA